MDVALKKMSAAKVAYIRHIGPYSDCGAAWKKLFEWLGKKKLLEKTKRKIGICYDDPAVTEPEKIRYDACIEIEGEIDGDDEISLKEIPSAVYAAALHVGPYEGLGKAYAYIYRQWMPENGKEIQADPTIEVYLNDPLEVSPEELKTEIYVPVK